MHARGIVVMVMAISVTAYMMHSVESAKASDKVKSGQNTNSPKRRDPSGKEDRGTLDRIEGGGTEVKATEYNFMALVQWLFSVNDVSISSGILITTNAVLTHGVAFYTIDGSIRPNLEVNVYMGISRLTRKNVTYCTAEEPTCQISPWDKERGLVTGKKQNLKPQFQMLLFYVKNPFRFSNEVALAMLAKGHRFPQSVNKKCQFVSFNWENGKPVQKVMLPLTPMHYSACKINMSPEDAEKYDDRICTTGHRVVVENSTTTTLVAPRYEDYGSVLVCKDAVVGMFVGYTYENNQDTHVLDYANYWVNLKDKPIPADHMFTPVYQFIGTELNWVMEDLFKKILHFQGTRELNGASPTTNPIS